ILHVAVGKCAKDQLPAVEPIGALQPSKLQTADHRRINIQLAAGKQSLAAVLPAERRTTMYVLDGCSSQQTAILDIEIQLPSYERRYAGLRRRSDRNPPLRVHRSFQCKTR